MKRSRKEFTFDLKVEELKQECPWLAACLTRMDIADIGDLHEVTSLITEDSENFTREAGGDIL